MKIYLIPSAIGEGSFPYISDTVREIIAHTRYYFVENERSARRFMSALGTGVALQELVLFRLTKYSKLREVASQFLEIPEGSSVGVLSEAGCPGIADPGALVVQYAHQHGYEVEPLPGPSAIFMALMSSGMSGQKFAFHGYLPQDQTLRQSLLGQLELLSSNLQQTQIFMETPYRNEALLADTLKVCQPHTQLCIAAGLHTPQQFVRTLPIAQWRNVALPTLHKVPTVFLLSATLQD